MKKILFFIVIIVLSMDISYGQKMRYIDDTHKGVPFSKDPVVVSFGDRYLMYYSVPPYSGQKGWNIGIAESRNLTEWTKIGEIRAQESYEKNGFCAPGALVRDDTIHLFYQTYDSGRKDAICHAWSTDGLTFTRDTSNPIFHPHECGWSCGRAIDAEVCEFKGQYFLYFATRDPSFKIQQQGVAVAPKGTSFRREDWTLATDTTILFPQLPWEGQCIEGATILKRRGRLYMFYAGNYNNCPQQIGVATSKDGIHWERLSDEPFLRNGEPGSWNESESGHPCIFRDRKGHIHLFFQGNNTKGKDWYLSRVPVKWKKGRPVIAAEKR